jgi:hypothetical protein
MNEIIKSGGEGELQEQSSNDKSAQTLKPFQTWVLNSGIDSGSIEGM